MSLRHSLSFLFLLLLALPASADDRPANLQGIVTWIHDGDTLEVADIGKVRLIGIDTPERDNSRRDRYLAKQGVTADRQRAIYRAAKAYNIERVKGLQVILTLDQPARDKYGRLLAYVHLPDGQILNQVLIEKGLAVVYRKFSFRLKKDFLMAEDKARQAEVGLWSKD